MAKVDCDAAQNALIGVMGGTFDPIHYAHLLMAEQAREQLALQRVIFIPAGRPPHKRDLSITPSEHRLAMTRIACEDNPAFEVSRREIDRPGPSYTITTIRELKAETGAGVCFITGSDSILEMGTWRQPDDILAESLVVTFPRPGFDIARIPQTLGRELAKKVRVLKAPLMDLSSTDIRERALAGLSIRYLVPEGVEEYIRQHALYRHD